MQFNHHHGLYNCLTKILGKNKKHREENVSAIEMLQHGSVEFACCTIYGRDKKQQPGNIYLKSLCKVLFVAEASPSPVALWDWQALLDYWLYHQLQQARGLCHC